MNGKNIFTVSTHERSAGSSGSTIMFNEYNVIARDAAEAIKKAAKVYISKSERPASVKLIGPLDAM